MKQTETSHAGAKGFDLLEPVAALQMLSTAQVEAARAVQHALADIALAAEVAADSLRRGGRLIYAAAGSSGLMALADALELPGTFGIDASRVKVLFAGGLGDMTRMPGGTEDDVDAARAAVAEAQVVPNDCLIALTASGTTPFPLAAARAARATGAKTIGLANNHGVPLFDLVDVAICLPTPPEVIAGSTRMGAGTAQKIALNMLSTLMAVQLGHVHDGLMVNLVADNIKLQGRARRIVMTVAGVTEDKAAAALATAGGAVKTAIVLAAGASDLDKAKQMLTDHDEHLRPVLAQLKR